MARKIPHRNRSPYGWWIASYLERAVWDDERKPSTIQRCLAWENTIVLKARNRDLAYTKAIKLGSQNKTSFTDDRSKRTGHWIFMGLTSLLPIYEPLEDGAEILWKEYENRTYGRLRRAVKTKRQLEVFDDTPAIGDKNN